MAEDGKKVSVPVDIPELKIGRKEDNHIYISHDTEISGCHARIVTEKGKYYIEDLSSTNGTFVNGTLINNRVELNNNFKFRLGKVEFILSFAPSSPGDFTHKYFKENAPRTLINSPLDRHLLKTKETIGRDPASNIYLDHNLVSWKHGEIKQSGTKYILTDLNSTNGTFYNGKRLAGSIELKADDVIQIGPFKLMFDGKSLARISEQGNIKLDIASLSVIRGKKKILNEVNLSINPQDFIAIVGPSGAGKSTLLKALCGASIAEEGIIKINGVDFYDNFDSFRSMLGYVPQDDIIHRQLTVKRALKYAAEMRLPSDMRADEMENVIKETLLRLEMTDHGEKNIRSLSGGQRKRVSIGVEMLTNPSLFYLDEPTSGLDPATERALMQQMRDRAKVDGKTVIMVTHVTKNMDLCDKLVFMGTGGYLTFYGSPAEALQFFEVTDVTDVYDLIKTVETAQDWSKKFHKSQYYINYIYKSLEASGLTETGKLSESRIKHLSIRSNNTSSIRQFWTLLKRYWDIKTKDMGSLVFTAITPAIVCVLLGLTFKSDVLELSEKGANFGDAAQLVFLLCCIALWFGSSNASLEIISELPIYLRERMINLRLLPYVLSKVVILSFISLVQSLLMTGVLLIFFQYMPHFEGLVKLTASIFLTFFTSIWVGLLISAFVNKAQEASGILPIVLVIQVILSGAIVPMGQIYDSLLIKPFTFIIPGRWGFSLIGESLKIPQLLERALDNYGDIYDDFKVSFMNNTINLFEKNLNFPVIMLIILSIICMAGCYIALWEKETRRTDFM